MNDKFSLLKFLLLFSIFLYSNLLKCPPDHFRPIEYYWPYDDYDDITTNYGFFLIIELILLVNMMIIGVE